jgi:Cu2+-exporting ATPase
MTGKPEVMRRRTPDHVDAFRQTVTPPKSGSRKLPARGSQFRSYDEQTSKPQGISPHRQRHLRGLVFIRGASGELADHKPGMMTLISLAIVVAFGTSLAATFGLFEVEVWWELASLITIMVLGHWLEMKAISQARGALNALAALLPDTAERVSGTDTQTVPIAELHLGDIVLVRPGTRVPADGTVVEGAADVDESMITGESRTVSKGTGGKVIAGTVATGGSLRVSITAVGDQTALSGIMRLVAAAQSSGSRTQALADRAAAILFYVAVASGATTFTQVERFVTVRALGEASQSQ